jgi:hypothetical protein
MYSKIWSVENQSAIQHIHPRIDRVCLGLANPKFEPLHCRRNWPRKEGGPRASLENLKWEGGSEVRDV